MNSNYKSNLKNNPVLKRINHSFLPKEIIEFNDLIKKRFSIDINLYFAKYLVLGLIFTGICSISFYFLKVALYYNIIFSLVVFFIIYYSRISLLRNRIRKLGIEIEKQLPLLKLELKFLQKILPPEIDILIIFIEIIANFNEGVLSEEFKRLNNEVMMAESLPEEALQNLRTFSVKFNNFIKKCSYIENIPRICSERENYSEFKVFLKTLESRLVILMAAGIFLPIIFMLVFLFSLIPSLLFSVAVFSHWLLLKVASNWLLKKRFALIYQQEILTIDKHTKINIFINFLENLARLLEDNSPEVAIHDLLEELNKETLDYMGVAKDIIYINSFQMFFHKILTNSKSDVIRLISSLILRLELYSGEDFGGLINDIIDELKVQERLDREKMETLKGERFRINILLIFSPIIFSIMTGVLPYLALPSFPQSSSMLEYASMDQFMGSFSGLDLILFFFYNVLFNYITTYYLTKSSGVSGNHKYAILTTLIFLLLFSIIFNSVTSINLYDFNSLFNF